VRAPFECGEGLVDEESGGAVAVGAGCVRGGSGGPGGLPQAGVRAGRVTAGGSASRPTTAVRPTPWAGRRLPTGTALPGAAPCGGFRRGSAPEICAGLLRDGRAGGVGCWAGRAAAGMLADPRPPAGSPSPGVLPLLQLGGVRYMVRGVRVRRSRRWGVTGPVPRWWRGPDPDPAEVGRLYVQCRTGVPRPR